MAKVLIIDDDESMCLLLGEAVRRLGHQTLAEHSLAAGMESFANGDWDVIFLDVILPDGSGLDALARFKSAPDAPEVIIITGLGDADGAELAIKSGAWDYIEKPCSLQQMTLPLMRALEFRGSKAVRGRDSAVKREGIIGSSPRLMESLNSVAGAARSDASVLITGETGTGKRLFATALHENSARSKGPFVVVDCSVLPDTLVESILFGHERGAFTGADRARDGLVLRADRGTLFLDEVGDMPLPVQKAFLRVLDERRFRPIGGSQELTSDFRLVAATNRDLPLMIEKGEFRQDLYFRLKSFAICLPPLRERVEDLPEMAAWQVDRICRRYGMPIKSITPDFLDALRAYDWPGNVREFMHALENSVHVAGESSALYPEHLPTAVRVRYARKGLKAAAPAAGGKASAAEVRSGRTAADYPSLKEVRSAAADAAERDYLRELMDRVGWDIVTACDLAKVSRTRLYGLLREHGITRRDRRP